MHRFLFELPPVRAWLIGTLVALSLLPLTVHADDPPLQQFSCPLDGTRTWPVGSDGKSAPRMYSDLEVPTQAYTNLVVACPKCGYASWTQDFERQPDGSVAGFVRSQLAATARRAQDPLIAYQHHLRILQHRNASVRERIGATLFYTYVLKRKRPIGGMDHALERQVADARKVTLALLEEALRADPPRKARPRLEWQYLVGELYRLTAQPKKAAPLLAEVCSQREEAGFMVGRLACEMAARAAKGESFEDYRDGVSDYAQVPPPGQTPAKPVEDKPQAAQGPKQPAEPKPSEPLPPMERQPPPRGAGDAVPPPPPATATSH